VVQWVQEKYTCTVVDQMNKCRTGVHGCKTAVTHGFIVCTGEQEYRYGIGVVHGFQG